MEPEELEALTDEELDGRCRPAALAVARTLLRNLPQEEAEECANDVMLRLLTHRERYEPSRGSLLTYVRVMARTEALSRLRRWNSRPLTLPLEEELYLTGGPEGTLWRGWWRAFPNGNAPSSPCAFFTGWRAGSWPAAWG